MSPSDLERDVMAHFPASVLFYFIFFIENRDFSKSQKSRDSIIRHYEFLSRKMDLSIRVVHLLGPTVQHRHLSNRPSLEKSINRVNFLLSIKNGPESAFIIPAL